MHRFVAVAILFVWSFHAMAEFDGDGFRTVFQEMSNGKPAQAYAAGFAFDSEQPHTFVSGHLHKSSEQPVSQSARWHIGSVTKSFTAVLTLRLVERGALSLTAPIGSYLSAEANIHPSWQRATLHQILSHTAGLRANAPILKMLESEPEDAVAGRMAVLESLWSKPLPRKPGAFHYSNIGYVLAGVLAEKVTGKSWEQLLYTEIAEPLGLISVGLGAPMGSDAPWGHRSTLGFTKAMNPTEDRADNPNWLNPAGRIHMSISELVKWGQVLNEACKGLRPEFLSADLCRAMRTVVADDYGYGLTIEPLAEYDATVVWHNGSNTLWYTVLAMVPEHNLVVAMSTNTFDARRIDNTLDELIYILLEDR